MWLVFDPTLSRTYSALSISYLFRTTAARGAVSSPGLKSDSEESLVHVSNIIEVFEVSRGNESSQVAQNEATCW